MGKAFAALAGSSGRFLGGGQENFRQTADLFYPPTENNDLSRNRFERQSMKATAISVHNGVARARIEGELKMQHSFYHKEDGKAVEATVVGFIDFEPSSRTIRSFQLVTDQATYGGGTFGVAVRSLK